MQSMILQEELEDLDQGDAMLGEAPNDIRRQASLMRPEGVQV